MTQGIGSVLSYIYFLDTIEEIRIKYNIGWVVSISWNIMFKKKHKLKQKQILKAKPVQNSIIYWEKDPNGEAILHVPRRNTWWINSLARILKIPPLRKIVLDLVGTYVWELCTGENTVADLIKIFQKKHKLTPKQAGTSMISYLNQMASRGLITFLLSTEKRQKTK